MAAWSFRSFTSGETCLFPFQFLDLLFELLDVAWVVAHLVVQAFQGRNSLLEVRDFVLVNSFKTTGDRVENGINTAATSAPIEIDLSFAQATQNKQLITFVEQANTLYIKNDGISSMVKG